MTHSSPLSIFLDRNRFMLRYLQLNEVIAFPVNPHSCSCGFQRLFSFEVYNCLCTIVYIIFRDALLAHKQGLASDML